MKAVILAAGEGKRLQPLTFERPKPLVKVLGKPLIQYVWEALPDEIDEVILVVGYKQKMIRDFLGNNFKGKKITYIEQKHPAGTGAALMLCRSHLAKEEKFLLMYADDLHSKTAIQRCLKHKAALLVSHVDDPRRFGVVVLNKDGTINNIEEKPKHPKSKLVVTGVYILPPIIFYYGAAEHPESDEYSLIHAIDKYINDYPMHVVETDFWLPIGFPDDVKRAEEVLGKRKK